MHFSYPVWFVIFIVWCNRMFLAPRSLHTLFGIWFWMIPSISIPLYTYHINDFTYIDYHKSGLSIILVFRQVGALSPINSVAPICLRVYIWIRNRASRRAQYTNTENIWWWTDTAKQIRKTTKTNGHYTPECGLLEEQTEHSIELSSISCEKMTIIIAQYQIYG